MDAFCDLLLGLGGGFAGAALIFWLVTRNVPDARSLDHD